MSHVTELRSEQHEFYRKGLLVFAIPNEQVTAPNESVYFNCLTIIASRKGSPREWHMLGEKPS
jgi:hypothetical protein